MTSPSARTPDHTPHRKPETPPHPPVRQTRPHHSQQPTILIPRRTSIPHLLAPQKQHLRTTPHLHHLTIGPHTSPHRLQTSSPPQQSPNHTSAHSSTDAPCTTQLTYQTASSHPLSTPHHTPITQTHHSHHPRSNCPSPNHHTLPNSPPTRTTPVHPPRPTHPRPAV